MNNLKGAAWMTLAMALYALVDSQMKLAMRGIPVGQVLLALGITGALAFAVAARLRGLLPLPASVFRGPALLRSLFDSAATASFMIAIVHVDLSLFTTIVQANPLLVVLGAAVFLREPVGWRRWLAIVVGLCGVLVVLRPTGDSFSGAALLVVLGVVFQAGRDLVTRMVDPTIDSLQLSGASFLILIVTACFTMLLMRTPPVMPLGAPALHMGAACLFILPSVYSMVASMRVGEVGFVAPFRYTRIVFGLTLGVFLFGERLDGWMIIGALIIVSSGLYSFWRETRARPSKSDADPL